MQQQQANIHMKNMKMGGKYLIDVLVLMKTMEQNSPAAIIPKKFQFTAPRIGFTNRKFPIPIIIPKQMKQMRENYMIEALLMYLEDLRAFWCWSRGCMKIPIQGNTLQTVTRWMALWILKRSMMLIMKAGADFMVAQMQSKETIDNPNIPSIVLSSTVTLPGFVNFLKYIFCVSQLIQQNEEFAKKGLPRSSFMISSGPPKNSF